MKPDQGVPDPASRSRGDARRVARPQRFFPFWTMETDPTGEEAPAGAMPIEVVRMSVVGLAATE
jgi:hypothetical protein